MPGRMCPGLGTWSGLYELGSQLGNLPGHAARVPVSQGTRGIPHDLNILFMVLVVKKTPEWDTTPVMGGGWYRFLKHSTSYTILQPGPRRSEGPLGASATDI